jgi:hypothetical protein
MARRVGDVRALPLDQLDAPILSSFYARLSTYLVLARNRSSAEDRMIRRSLSG